MHKIDWQDLAAHLGTLSMRGATHVERGGDDLARQALVTILGPSEINGAVRTALDHGPGSELARSVLALLKPASAMRECYRLYRESSDIQERRLALALLSGVADHSALDWIDEFLQDPDAIIQAWGAKVLIEVVLGGHVRSDGVDRWADKVERHPNDQVRAMAARLRAEAGEG